MVKEIRVVLVACWQGLLAEGPGEKTENRAKFDYFTARKRNK